MPIKPDLKDFEKPPKLNILAIWCETISQLIIHKAIGLKSIE
jgi:hypothetical protein